MSHAETLAAFGFTLVSDRPTGRAVARSIDFEVVDVIGYFEALQRQGHLSLHGLTTVARCFALFARGERHLLLRRVLTQGIRNTGIPLWQALVAEEVRSALAELTGPRADLVRDFAARVHSRVMARYAGLPAELSEHVGRWGSELRFLGEFMLPLRTIVNLNSVAEEFLAALERVASGPETAPVGCLLGEMYRAAGDELSRSEVRASLVGLFIAGHLVPQTLANIILHILRRGISACDLPTDASMRRQCLEGLLRRYGAAQYLPRVAKQQQCVSGRDFVAGERILVDIAAYNRGTGCPVDGEHMAFGVENFT